MHAASLPLRERPARLPRAGQGGFAYKKTTSDRFPRKSAWHFHTPALTVPACVDKAAFTWCWAGVPKHRRRSGRRCPDAPAPAAEWKSSCFLPPSFSLHVMCISRDCFFSLNIPHAGRKHKLNLCKFYNKIRRGSARFGKKGLKNPPLCRCDPL